MNTVNGNDILHDTVGIIFHTDVYEIIENNDITQEQDCHVDTKKKTFETITQELQLLLKKKKKSLKPLLNEDLEWSISELQRSNLLWMISHAVGIPKTPKWVGFNSVILLDDLSPTNSAVIKETMNEVKQIALECNESYMQISYDSTFAQIGLHTQ